MFPCNPQSALKEKRVAIVGCPFSGGQARGGVDFGPEHMINAGLIDQVKELGWDVTFEGHQQFEQLKPAANEDPDVGRLKNPRYVSAVTKAVSGVVEKHCKRGEFPLTVGGDHSLAIGTVSGVMAAYPDACLVWVDAHADINTPHSTPSGNIHGCPLSFVTGAAEPCPDVFSWVPKCLPFERIAYIGLRDLDPVEKQILRENNVCAYTMHHVDKYGIGRVVEMALERINPGLQRPIHLSFDVDAMDPAVAPATGTPVRGGLTWREGMYICEALHETGKLVAMDLMEVNPVLGASEQEVQATVHAGLSLARCALGETLL
ncbi:Ureohydrolase [Saitoella complicata NRRL Y-17804]|uniref:Arginase n=1 Tax=Saitoella complicata (strain BCRC 22490 / CBS 7301 / JCM 7358 / NBRC 10748 / NRRL Y-17804) TaxID=698492 RepID=A0A0E9NL47_SAICN|nr:Ureohydrolase [Saitoella complicata NRRL Y-17804]ODQ51776.1 Ureohydrolase [Saitoella complicata NRRL Y-17804]GAO50607.1 hypothetical protein G7K_4731-t1 [Saitoella complicata NRRL Y-17804]